MAEKITAVLKFKFQKVFDGRMPPHWAILLRTAAPPFTMIQLFDSPIAPSEVMRVRLRTFDDPDFFDFEGTIPAGADGNKTEGDLIVETVEKDIPAEVLEDTDKVMRVKFEGLLLNGTLVIDKELHNASWEPGTGPQKTTEAKHRKRRRSGREYASVKDILESREHEDAVELSVDIADFEQGLLEAVYAVKLNGKTKYFRTPDAAHAYKDKHPGAEVSSRDKLPAGATLESIKDESDWLSEAIARGAVTMRTLEAYAYRVFKEQEDAMRARLPDPSAGLHEYIEAICKEAGIITEIFRVTHAGKTKYFRRRAQAKAYADRYSDTAVTKIDALPAGAQFEEATMAPEGKVYQVIWADGRGVQYFDNLEAAQEFADQKGRDARPPKLIDKPAGARVKSEAPELKESNETLLESEKESLGDPAKNGIHAHPHDQNGEHEHSGLPAGGGHEHNTETFGAHQHKDGDPLDGQHMNIGDGAHDHLLAKGLQDYIDWSAKVHMTHPWIPNYKTALIRHTKPVEDKEAREATLEDWKEHTIWSMHSTGKVNVGAHASVFLDSETSFIEKQYVMQDGTSRTPTPEDFEAEAKWFDENTPPELAQKLVESHIVEAVEFKWDFKTMTLIAKLVESGEVGEGGYSHSFTPGDGQCRSCEATGHVLINRSEEGEHYRARWEEAELQEASKSGYHPVTCVDCDGTGRLDGKNKTRQAASE